MSRCTIGAFLSLFVLAAAGCRSGSDPVHEQQVLLDLDRAWAADAGSAKPDVDKIASYWADGARVMMPGQPEYVGIESIRQMVATSVAIPGFHITWTPERAVVSSSGDFGYTYGANEILAPDLTGGIARSLGRYVTIWRKDRAGKWRCVMDYTTPAAGAAPANAN